MRRYTAFILGLLWLVLLLVIDASITFRRENLRQHINRLLYDACGQSVTYASFHGSYFGPFELTGVQIRNPPLVEGLPSADRAMLEVPRLQIWVDWTGLLFGGRALRRVHFERPWVRLFFRDEELVLPEILESSGGGKKWDITQLPAAEIDGLDLTIVAAPYLLTDSATFSMPKLKVQLRPEVSGEGSYWFEARLVDEVLGDLTASGRLSRSGLGLTMQRDGIAFSKDLLTRLDSEVARLLGGLEIEGSSDLFARFRSGDDPQRSGLHVQLNFAGARVGYRDWLGAIQDLRGDVIYEHGRFEAVGLGGYLEGARFELEGSYDLSVGDPSLHALVTLKGLEIDEDLVEGMAMLPPPGPVISEQLKRWEVRGPVNASLILEQGGRLGREIRPTVSIDLGGCAFMYRGSVGRPGGVREGFHYPLTAMRGNVRVTDRGLELTGLTARRGPMVLEASGSVDFSRAGDETYDVLISAMGLAIDDDLMAAMSPDAQAVLRSLGVRGAVNAWVRPVRRSGEVAPGIPEVTVHLKQIELLPDAFPYRFENVSGTISVEDGYVNVQRVRGERKGGRILIDGRVRIGGERVHSRLELSARNLPIDDELLGAIRLVAPEAGALLDRVELEGRLDIEDLVISKREVGEGSVVEGRAILAGVRLRDRATGVEVEIKRGGLGFGNDGLSILEGTVVSVGGIEFVASGSTLAREGYRLLFEASGHRLRPSNVAFLRQFIPAMKDLPDLPQLEGEANVLMRFKGDDRGSDRAEVRLDLNHVAVTLPGEDGGRLEDVGCHVTFDLRRMQGRVTGFEATVPRPVADSDAGAGDTVKDPWDVVGDDDLRVFIHTVNLSLGGSVSKIHMERVTLGLPTSPWFLSLLGMSEESIAELGLPSMAGEVSANLQTAMWDGGRFSISDGNIIARDLRIGTGSELFVELGGIRNLTLTSEGGRTLFSGDLDIARMRMLKVPLQAVRAHVRGSEAGAFFTEIDGRIIGTDDDGDPYGVIERDKTTFQVGFRDGSFSLNALFRDVNLGEFARVWGASAGSVGGRARLRGSIEGRMGRSDTYRGKGVLEADARRLLEVPLFLKILNVLSIFSPEELLTRNARTRVTVSYDLRGDLERLKLPSILMGAPSLELKGRGYVTFDGLVNASLDATHKGPVPVLSFLFSLLPGMILGGVDIEGPLESPQVTAKAFSGGGVESDVPGSWAPVTKPLKR